MNRRNAIAALLALGASPREIRAQGVPRLCFITFDPGTLQSNRYGIFFDALKSLGYASGSTLRIDYLSAQGRADQFTALAQECTRLKADVIVVATTPAAQAAKQVTKTTPIVMLALGDPMGAGLVDSFARPGGNVTGMSFVAPAVAAKRIELLRELAPRTTKVLLLTYPIDPISKPQVDAIRKVTSALGLGLVVRDVRTPEDIPPAFEAGIAERADALSTTAESFFVVNRVRVIELAAKYKLPAAYGNQSYPPSGGLMSYVADFPALYAGAAKHVDKILKGAKAADLPVEQPTKFELILNLKTAKAQGIPIPAPLLARADTVIE